MPLSFADARAAVISEVTASVPAPAQEQIPIGEAGGRVLAAPAHADRDYPALDRSVRDGFAIYGADLPGPIRVIGEVRAGESFAGEVHRGEAVEIMTGAPLPAGADTVVMVEHVIRNNGSILHESPAANGQFISRRGEEAREGDVLVPAGKRLSYSDIALIASSGHATVSVFRKPRAAIVATGDELVEIAQAPLAHQVRNSNAVALARQIALAGGTPVLLPIARDEERHTRELIERGLSGSDLLLLSGGVSAGKYDIVERVLASLGAEFFFDRVAIQPGQPVVFGRVAGRFFFGLPGNPVSTMVTFEIFARAALELLGGQSESALPFALGRLTRPFRHKTGLTRFLPASVCGWGDLTPVTWQGSGDMPSLARANAFLVAAADRESWDEGETMPVLLK